MFDLRVIHTFSNGVKIPKWLIVSPTNGCFDWSSTAIYIPLDGDFHSISHEDINDDMLSLSILNSELITHTKFPDHIGVYLPHVKKRINKIRGEKFAPQFLLSDIRQFVIQMADIETATKINFSSLVEWC